MKKRKWLWGLIAIIVILFIVGVCGGSVTLVAYLTGGDLEIGEAVAIVPVEGVIVSGEPVTPFSDNMAYSGRIIGYLRQAQDNASVKAIVLRINSPGGSVVASDEIYNELLKVEKPVVVSMGEMAASGGYYISCAADKILANPSTLTGSIGVIAQMPNLEDLMEKIGVDVTTIKSGAHKDEGSPFREMTKEEKAIWQTIINESHEQFMSIVAKGRGLSEEKVKELADGRVYTGQQAVELGLADQLGNLPEAIDLAAELGGIEGKPRLIKYRRPPTLLESLLGSWIHSTFITLDRFLGFQPYTILQYLYVTP